MLYGLIQNPVDIHRANFYSQGLKTIGVGGSQLARFRCSRLFYERIVRPLIAVYGTKAAKSFRCSETRFRYLLEDERCFALLT